MFISNESSVLMIRLESWSGSTWSGSAEAELHHQEKEPRWLAMATLLQGYQNNWIGKTSPSVHLAVFWVIESWPRQLMEPPISCGCLANMTVLGPSQMALW